MVGLLTVSSGGLVAEGLSVTVVGLPEETVVGLSEEAVVGLSEEAVVGLPEEAVVEGRSVGGAVVVGCVGAGGHRVDKLRSGLFIGRKRVCMTPLLAAMSASTILLPPTLVSLPSIATEIEHLLLLYHLY